ncbi:RNA 2',3'-cyclic phosphodiesterase [Sutcliffiella horikoshii]|uniref:RNA 2',3'-cyclic phosphodiesterase n=1 Tax=Sutcliffiella horikoshii TaxID=79883 RepID=A0AA94WM21_9BACI|nr:RNA 2',3'-cyclic phosphodiesterase [Sutcliffiella horikoshii]TYS55642.1 RNA 2',3'-cyclic phosphodiesterase [Sutcliffiella horikoshii]
MTTQTHYFVAVPLPQPLKQAFQLYMKKLKSHFPFTRWVHPEDLHITLAFLGDLEEGQKEKLISLLSKVALNHQRFSLGLSELGTFGNPQSPRIFWYGIEKSMELNLLRNSVYDACEMVGLQLDSRPFHPHITIARKWKGPGSIDNSLLPVHSSQIETFAVNNIILYETHLNRLPKYEEKEIFSLV